MIFLGFKRYLNKIFCKQYLNNIFLFKQYLNEIKLFSFVMIHSALVISPDFHLEQRKSNRNRMENIKPELHNI